MTLFKLLKITLFSTLLTSCAFDTYQLTQTTSVNKTKIQIYYPNLPSCNYDVLGIIDVKGFYFSKNSLFLNMAEEAEKLNADGVIIGYLQQLDIKEYIAVGEAILCNK